MGRQRMPYTGPLEDRIALRELVERYADGVFRKDSRLWGDTWAEDGIWELRGIRVEGRASIIEYWIKAMDTIDVLGFFQQLGSIEIDGDRAKSRAYLYEWGKWKDGETIHSMGFFEDIMVKKDGMWLFKHRSHNGLLRD
jgi:hypothetical protein